MTKYQVSFYSEIPVFNNHSPGETLGYIIEYCKRAEEYRYVGSLIYFSHSTLDPWIIAQIVLENTREHIPLVAVQVNYYHPVTVIKAIQTLEYLYRRKVNLNFITGANKSELNEINQHLDHSSKYKKMEEFIQILSANLMQTSNFEFIGDYFKINKLNLSPAITNSTHHPDYFISGMSEDSMSVASRCGSNIITHPEPLEYFQSFSNKCKSYGIRDIGIRIQIIARATSVEAWDYANSQYKYNEFDIASVRIKKNSDSEWLRRISSISMKYLSTDTVYWMGAFVKGRSNCPSLVGSYEEVANYLKGYIDRGVRSIIIHDLFTEEQFYHMSKVREQLLTIGEVGELFEH